MIVKDPITSMASFDAVEVIERSKFFSRIALIRFWLSVIFVDSIFFVYAVVPILFYLPLLDIPKLS